MGLYILSRAGAAARSAFGYRWQYGQLDDRVEFINDLPADVSGQAPGASRRALLLGKIRPFQCDHNLSNIEFLQDDVRLKRDGTASNLTNPLKLQMTRIPSFYTTGYMGSNNYVYRLFSERYQAGWEEVKSFGYPRYKGKIVGDKLLSYSGVFPSDSMSLITADAYARNTNAVGRVTPFYLYQPLLWLSVLDTGRFNMQAYYAGITNAGASYSNAAPTGVLDTLLTPSGQKSYEYQTGLFTSPFRWRFIEQFFGQTWNILSGIYIVCEAGWMAHKVYVATNPAQINTNNDYSGLRLIGEIPQVSGWLSEFLPGTILPATVGASSTTGKSDYTYNPAAGAFVNTAIVGGTPGSGDYAGPGCFNSGWNAADATVYVGASFVLPELPEAAAQPPG